MNEKIVISGNNRSVSVVCVCVYGYGLRIQFSESEPTAIKTQPYTYLVYVSVYDRT